VEESFLDLKSNGFNLEASRLRDKFALSQLCGVIALTTLFLVLQGTFLSSLPDPEPAFASNRQQENEFMREFVVLSRIPAS
jgi:hypothetical protein